MLSPIRGCRMPMGCWASRADASRRSVDQDGVARGDGRSSGRSIGRGAYFAGARKIDAGLGLGGCGVGISAGHQSRSALSDGSSLVRIIVPRAAGKVGGGAGTDVDRPGLDPISSIIARDVAAVHFLRRDLSAALDQCDHTIEINPHFPQAYWILGLVQEQRGDFDESAAAFRGDSASSAEPANAGCAGADVCALRQERRGEADSEGRSGRNRLDRRPGRRPALLCHFAGPVAVEQQADAGLEEHVA